jgi:hypothetical protein
LIKSTPDKHIDKWFIAIRSAKYVAEDRGIVLYQRDGVCRE